MPAAPSPDLIVTDPPPLSPYTAWPFRVDPFPANVLFAGGTGLLPKDDPTLALPENPTRRER